jgi:hypothetical protein
MTGKRRKRNRDSGNSAEKWSSDTFGLLAQQPLSDERIWIEHRCRQEDNGVSPGFFPNILTILVAGGSLMKMHLSLLALLSLSCASVAQTAPPQTPPASAGQQPTQQAVQGQATQTDFTSKKGFVLEEETPVRLRLNRTISSADAHVGDTVDFEALDDITVNGTLVIPKGGLAFATVTEAQAKRRMARGGRLDINIDYVKLESGDKAALRAVKDVKGGGHTGGMVGGMVATAIVFFPAAPFFLFMHGKDISIPKGTEITAYVNGDVKLDIAKFQPTAPASAPAQGAVASSLNANGKLQVESDPPGADIELDGSFVGNTPSDVEVTEGEHTVSVKKTGFKDWERKLKVSGGSDVHLSVDLEKVANP